ncbi:cation-translocating P-type ATPase [Euzebya sp.]|uniref:cation-translocating P-type ATPase n=1 Tax=Euzebya sp. TaxID=1971409 RepID=UPI0035174B24
MSAMTDDPTADRRTDLPDSPWADDVADVAAQLDVDARRGLSGEEAGGRLERYGPNEVAEEEGRSRWRIVLDQFLSPIIYILLAAGLAALVAGEVVEAIAVLIAVVINAVIGYVTELRAIQSVESLRELGRTTAAVRRDGKARQVDAAELVPGDLVMLEEGDVMPADLRLIDVANLQVDEAPLTGESVPQTKHTEPVDADTPLAERTPMAYKGTRVTSGSGAGLITATGAATQIGEVASLVEESSDDADTPLEERLDDLAKALIVAVIVVGVVVAVAGIAVGQDVQTMIETAVALAVAAVPEGLAVVATLSLARGVVRMARHNALVKELASVETLGSASVIFTDKTGTLTEGRMRAEHLLLPDDREVDIAALGEGQEPEGAALAALLVGALCGNATVGEDGPEGDVGDPMEVALQRGAVAAGLGHRGDLTDVAPEEREVAFDRETKMMATYHRIPDDPPAGFPPGQLLVAVKGAPGAVLDACTTVAGQTLDDERREAWRESQGRLAAQGVRVLGLARKVVDSVDAEPYADLELLGMVGLMDPPRAATADAIASCQRAGVEVVMVTGDQPATAEAIARDIGLLDADAPSDGSAVLRGRDIPPVEEWDDDLRERLAGTRVFARLDPKQKLDLIALARERGAVVGMTGDGVNDAPALKRADIGIAMGEKGTQVARDAADIVLQDDAFETIVTAIREGRTIFENIRRFVVYLLSGNLGEILAVTAAAVSGAALPLLPLQILYINLVSDVFPAAALGVLPGDEQALDRPPRDPRQPILGRSGWTQTVVWAVLIGGMTLGVFAWALGPAGLEEEQAVTVSFLAFVIARLLHVFNMRDADESLWHHPVLRSGAVWSALGASFGLVLLALAVPPLTDVLGLVVPTAQMWLLAGIGGGAVLVLGQVGLWALGRVRSR